MEMLNVLHIRLPQSGVCCDGIWQQLQDVARLDVIITTAPANTQLQVAIVANCVLWRMETQLVSRTTDICVFFYHNSTFGPPFHVPSSHPWKNLKVLIRLKGYCYFHQSKHKPLAVLPGILPAAVCNLVCRAKSRISNSTAGLWRWHCRFGCGTCITVLSPLQIRRDFFFAHA